MANTYNPSTQEEEARNTEVQGYDPIHEATLDDLWLCLKGKEGQQDALAGTCLVTWV